MFVCSVVPAVLALSLVALATGNPRYTQYAFKFQSSANCLECSVENSTCFYGILSCVQLSFNTHNATLVTRVTNVTEMWMLLVLQLRPSKIDSSEFVKECTSSVASWKFWNYAECTMDISRVDGYQNCSTTSHLSYGSPVLQYAAWIFVVLAVLATFAAVLSTILCVICCKKWSIHHKIVNFLKGCCHNEGREKDPDSEDDPDERRPLNNLSVQSESSPHPLSSEPPSVAYEPNRYGAVGPAYSNPTARPTVGTSPVSPVAAEGASSEKKLPIKCPNCGHKLV